MCREIHECFQRSKERAHFAKGASRHKYVNILSNSNGPSTPKERERTIGGRANGDIRATRNNGRKNFPRAFLPRRRVTDILHNDGRTRGFGVLHTRDTWHTTRTTMHRAEATTARAVCHKHVSGERISCEIGEIVERNEYPVSSIVHRPSALRYHPS